MFFMFFSFSGMPTDKRDNKVNLGHERKQKRIDNKITKPGGKRPQRCDKEPATKYISPYFQGNQDNTKNIYPTRQGANPSEKIEPITSTRITHGLTNITNLLPSSTSNVVATPNRIQTIRLLAPIGVGFPPQQFSQTVIRNPT